MSNVDGFDTLSDGDADTLVEVLVGAVLVSDDSTGAALETWELVIAGLQEVVERSGREVERCQVSRSGRGAGDEGDEEEDQYRDGLEEVHGGVDIRS